MKDNHGTTLLPVWQVMTTSGVVIIAAWTGLNALLVLRGSKNHISDGDGIDKYSFSRIKNCAIKTNTEKVLAV